MILQLILQQLLHNDSNDDTINIDINNCNTQNASGNDHEITNSNSSNNDANITYDCNDNVNDSRDNTPINLISVLMRINDSSRLGKLTGCYKVRLYKDIEIATNFHWKWVPKLGIIHLLWNYFFTFIFLSVFRNSKQRGVIDRKWNIIQINGQNVSDLVSNQELPSF